MLYRVGSGGAYEFAVSDDQLTVRPGTTWMTQEEAHALRAATGAPTHPAEPAAAQPADAAAPDMANVIKDAISELAVLTGETASQIAGELGLTEEELAHVAEHPDLERMVAEELAQLMGQQQSA